MTVCPHCAVRAGGSSLLLKHPLNPSARLSLLYLLTLPEMQFILAHNLAKFYLSRSGANSSSCWPHAQGSLGTTVTADH